MKSDDKNDSSTIASDMSHLLRNTYLFKGFDHEQFGRFLLNPTEISFKSESDVFRQGDESDVLYLIKEGRISVTEGDASKTENVTELGSGSLFGEVELYTGVSRTATVRTITDVVLICINKTEFKRILSLEPDFHLKIGVAIQQRFRRNRFIEIIPQLFGDDITEDEIEEIESHGRWQHLTAGEFLMRKGDPGGAMSILVDGRLRALLPIENEAPQILGDITRGETIGEMSLFSEESRSADVIAVRDSSVVEFSKESFEKIAETHHSVLMRVSEIVIKRLRNTQETTAKTGGLSVVALVGISNEIVVGEFSQRLTDAVADLSTVCYLTKEKIEKILGETDIGEIAPGEALEIRLETWLDDQEEKYDLVFYQCDDSQLEWTRRCVSRADRILLIGHASQDPVPNDFEVGIGDLTTVRKDLVIVHSDESKAPANTMEWLDPRQVHRHYHIRWNVQGDFMRLARFMTGKAVGLVISGGGIRAAAGIGAFRALQEAGVEIDAVGGNSGGSMVAVGIGLNWENKKILEALATAVRLYRKNKTLPLLSMFTGKHFINFLKDRVGDIRAEDTLVPFYCVTTNLSRGELSVHNSGPLYRLMRTSMSLPGMLPPVIWNGDWHLDGCVASNNPVEAMSEVIEGGKIISIDLFSVDQLEKEKINDVPEDISGFSLLLSRFTKRLRGSPVPKSLPSISELIERCVEINVSAVDSTSVRSVDLHVTPAFHKNYLFQWEDAEEIEAIGYQATKASLIDWDCN